MRIHYFDTLMNKTMDFHNSNIRSFGDALSIDR